MSEIFTACKDQSLSPPFRRMTHKDCLELRDAGFPQSETEKILYTVDSPSAEVNNKDYYALRSDDLGELPISEVLACPTLDELIAELGDEFHCLVHTVNEDEEFWSVGKNKIVKEWQTSTSPILAVKELYVAVNKDKLILEDSKNKMESNMQGNIFKK